MWAYCCWSPQYEEGSLGNEADMQKTEHRVGKKQELMVPLEYLDPAII
jgi:hypothetical protein